MGMGSDLLRIAVCDDEEQFRALLSSKIKEFFVDKDIKTEIVGFESGEALLKEEVGALAFDVVFLDVDMGKEGGFATAQNIRKHSADIPIVFVTGIYSTWNKGYEVGAFRYIIKDPRSFDKLLLECLESLKSLLFPEIISINLKTQGGNTRIPVSNIAYVESKGHSLCYYVFNHGSLLSYMVRGKLSNCEKEMSGFGFVRIHQSFIVNPGFVDNVANYRVKLFRQINDLPVTRDKYKEIKTTLMAAKGAF